MPAVAVVSLVIVALIVAALAFYLTWVVLLLRSIHDTLGKVTFGVRAIAHRTAPLGALLSEVNGNLIPVADALEARVGTAARPEDQLRRAEGQEADEPSIPDHAELEASRQGSEMSDGA